MSIQSSPPRYFWLLGSCHFLNVSWYLIEFLLLWTFSIVGLGLGLIVGLGSVLVLFFFAFFPFPCRLKVRKLPPGRLPLWLSSNMFRLHCIGRGFDVHAMIIFLLFKKFFCKVFCKLRLGLELGKCWWWLSGGQKSCASAGCIDYYRHCLKNNHSLLNVLCIMYMYRNSTDNRLRMQTTHLTYIFQEY